ncbi:MAG: hypothetical protein GX087_12195 [Desulfobulbaceae bacterium]|nr:hypothetical protein [Desulfobulbaceae bacterium]
MPRLSFSNHVGRYCREHEERLTDGSEHQIRYGLACWENDHWQYVSVPKHQDTVLQAENFSAEKYMPVMGEEEESSFHALIDELIQGTLLSLRTKHD